ncbi:MAG: exosortase K [Syntrophobacteraceae bacterium]
MMNVLRKNAVYYGLGFLMVFALKAHYSRATSDDLGWILIPTAALVEWIFGIPFEREAHAGAINREYGIILAPACAGVNFLIICFSTLWFSILHRIVGSGKKMIWLGASAVMSYLLTLVVNGLRIVVSIFLYRADIYGGWVTPERVHRMEGTLIYCAVLVLIYPIGRTVAEWLNGRSSREIRWTTAGEDGWKPLASLLAIPFAWYGAVTIATPFLNRAWRHNGARFAEHCGFVVGACAMVLLLALLVVLGSRWIRCGIGRHVGRFRKGGGKGGMTSTGSLAARRERVT